MSQGGSPTPHLDCGLHCGSQGEGSDTNGIFLLQDCSWGQPCLTATLCCMGAARLMSGVVEPSVLGVLTTSCIEFLQYSD